jgi:gliding motility-associated-like protein
MIMKNAILRILRSHKSTVGSRQSTSIIIIPNAIYFILTFSFLSLQTFNSIAQQILNNGVSATITPNTYVCIGGTLKNAGTGGTVNNYGSIILNGNYVNDSIFNSGNNSSVKLNGALQDIGGSVPTTFNKLIIDGSADKTISIPTYINDSLIFNANHFKIGNNNLTLLQNAVHSGTSNSKFIITNGTGSLVKRSVPLSNDFLFPIGDSTISSGYTYKPVILNDSSISTVDTFSVRVASGLLPATGADPACVQYTWFVQESNPGGSVASIDLGWNSIDEGTSFHRDTAYIWQYKNSTWNIVPRTPGYTTNAPATDYHHKTSGITNFSANANRFILRSYSNAIINSQDTSHSACENTGNSVAFNVAATGSGIQYQWQEDCGSGWINLTNNTIYTGAQTNTLSLYNPGLGMNGCQYQCIIENLLDTITSQPAILTVHSLPHAFAGNDTTIFAGNSAQLNASGGIQYQWSPSTYLNNPDIPNPISTPLNNISYTVTVVDGFGCADADTINIIVDESAGIFVPDIFAPKSSLVHNQTLYVSGKGIKDMDFIVYDRWGEKVFETNTWNDPSAGWDGTFKGEKLSSAVFVYYVKATFYNGQKVERKGNVTLLR